MKIALLTGTLLALGAGFAAAQTTNPAQTDRTPATTGTMPSTPAPGLANPGGNPGLGAMSNPGSSATPQDRAAASTNHNPAISTGRADAMTPAKGANSFTAGEARRRIQGHGYSAVAGLTKDHDGIWHGHAQKDGHPVDVWLDYKGNVGYGQM